MRDNFTCKLCDADLRGEPIPQEYIDKGYYGEEATHYSRLIGIEIQGGYDGISYWKCPECNGMWDRFTGEEVKDEGRLDESIQT